jgi:hypothetical protein
MSTNIIEEYLVKLGFETDDPSIRKFQGILAEAEHVVSSRSTGMSKSILEAQGAIFGAFTSISAAIIGTVDKAAMADQSYRLLGLRMLMTTESARKMDLITKALGADLPTIVWDKELHQRAVDMGERIDKMTSMLGPGFEKSMKSIRDVHVGFDQLAVDVKFLGYKFAFDLWDKIAPGDPARKVAQWLDWFEAKIPELSQKLVGYAVPALHQTWEMIKSVGDVLRAGSVAFTNMIGILSGDKSIQGTAFSFDNLAKSIQHVGDWMVKFFQWITHAEELLAHFATAAMLAAKGDFAGAAKAFGSATEAAGKGTGKEAPKVPDAGHFGDAAMKALSGDKAGAVKELKANWWKDILKSIDPDYGTSKDGQFGLLPRAAWDFIHRDPQRKKKASQEFNEWWNGVKSPESWFGGPEAPKPTVKPSIPEAPAASTASPAGQPMLSKEDLIGAIERSAATNGVNKYLAMAVAQAESGINQGKTSPRGAVGVMQLMPDTAKDMGVDPNDALQNIAGGVRYLGILLDRYHGDERKAIEAYNAGMSKVDKARSAADLPRETREYAPKVLDLEKMFERGKDSATPTAASPSLIIDVPKFQPLWLQPPADDSKPKSLDYWTRPAPQTSVNRDWTPVMNSVQRPFLPQAPSLASSRSETTVDVGGIFITQPGADAHQIQKAVTDGIRAAQQEQTQLNVAQLNPTY